MKRFLSIILAILTIFTFTACSSGSENNTNPPTEPEQETAMYYVFDVYYRYDIKKYYHWGDKLNGTILTDKYANFTLKDDESVELWWLNKQYSGIWKLVGTEIRIVYNDGKDVIVIMLEGSPRISTNDGCIYLERYKINI